MDHRSLMTCGMAGLLLACVLAAAQTSAAPDSPAARNDQKLVKDFQDRVKGYMELRTKEAGKSPKPTASSDKLADKRDQIAESIRTLRAGARQGDIFTPDIEQYFRRQIAATLKGEQGEKIRTSLRRAEPVNGVSLKVNQAYPQKMPLQSTPPSLLLNLPSLPKELQYRIVGNDLVLVDTAPNLVVDFIPHVFPRS